MFALQPKPIFKMTVDIPTTNGPQPIKFEFKHMGRKAFAAFYAALGEAENAREDKDVLMDLIAGWDGVDAKFDAEALDMLLDNYPGATQVIFDQYKKGLFEGGQKNSVK